MPKNFNLGFKIDWKGKGLKDPRLVMRLLIGTLLLANLVVAVIAFKPFGGSADELRQDQARLSAQLRQMQTKLDKAKQMVDKVQIARTQGDEFVTKYIMDMRSEAAIVTAEMIKAATDAGIKYLPMTQKLDLVEGSDNIYRVAIEQGFEGQYANLAKLVNLLEKSPQFLIVDTMTLNAPQSGPQGGMPMLNVTLKIMTFARDDSGAGL